MAPALDMGMNTETHTGTVAVIYTCRMGCKQGHKKMTRRVDTLKRVERMVNSQGQHARTDAVYTGEDGRECRNRLPRVTCQGCRQSMIPNEVKGLYSASVPCDARCTGATGHTCECSCGGANHGADHR